MFSIAYYAIVSKETLALVLNSALEVVQFGFLSGRKPIFKILSRLSADVPWNAFMVFPIGIQKEIRLSLILDPR
jgi:hypothetical protein